ncbi:MAG: hypothetical protein LBD53_08375 [Tannerella sp.]|jgi:nicotinamide-nucleotide amidase|nr:hypothetical protein [Tannerella sp.]
MDVEIITIGDELLIGQVVDTNSAWMGKILNKHGFRVVRRTVVGDVANDITDAVDAAMRRVRIVLLTGGLGPTRDDITLKTLCQYFGCALKFSDQVYDNIKSIFSRKGRVMNELTRLQAMVPETATIITNRAGTAPCSWFERDGKVLVSMPGVPAEMTWLMENEVMPRLIKTFGNDMNISHQTFTVTGYSESELAIKLTDFEDNLPSFIRLAYLPDAGLIRLRLSAYNKDVTANDDALIAASEQLRKILGDACQ